MILGHAGEPAHVWLRRITDDLAAEDRASPTSDSRLAARRARPPRGDRSGLAGDRCAARPLRTSSAGPGRRGIPADLRTVLFGVDTGPFGENMADEA